MKRVYNSFLLTFMLLLISLPGAYAQELNGIKEGRSLVSNGQLGRVAASFAEGRNQVPAKAAKRQDPITTPLGTARDYSLTEFYFRNTYRQGWLSGYADKVYFDGNDVYFKDLVYLVADGTYVTVRGGGPKAEVKAMVAYAGKEAAEGGRVSRVDPVRLGCVGVAPGEFWREAVAQVGSRFDLGRVERVSLGTDGEAQYVNGISAMSFAAESDGHIDPFHVDRAVARCAPAGSRLGRAMLQVLEAGGPEACAFVIESLASVGALRGGSDKVAAYLRNHAPEIGGGPSMGTMEAEQQHTYKVRMASFPCAWSLAGADAMARCRSWIASGREVPRRTREQSLSPKRRRARDERLARMVDPTPGRRLQSEGRGWEYPLTASVEGMRADIRFGAALDLI